MIVTDTSSLLAVFFKEPEASYFLDILEYNEAAIPASVLVEAGILTASQGKQQEWNQFLSALGAVILPLDHRTAEKAVQAFLIYGKGRHKASLNFGDCLVYATAQHLDLPLLFKGNDFIHTDVRFPGFPPVSAAVE